MSERDVQGAGTYCITVAQTLPVLLLPGPYVRKCRTRSASRSGTKSDDIIAQSHLFRTLPPES